MKNNSNLISTILSAGLVILLLAGGLGEELFLVRFVGLLIGLVMLVMVGILDKKLKLPKWWWLYGLFLLVLWWGQSWSRRKFTSLDYLYLFLSGGVLWLASFNWRQELRKVVDKVALAVGLVFSSLFIYTYYFTDPRVDSWSLYLPYTRLAGYHNNVADLWGVVGLVALFAALKYPKKVLPWIGLGATSYLMYMGESRSALISFGLSGWWLIEKMKPLKQHWKTTLIAGVTGLVLVIGSGKTILFSRQYYFQAVAGLIEYPQGIGMGSFRDISLDPQFHWWGISDFASVVHNLILEIMSGVGWWGVVFVVWLGLVGKRVMKESKKKRVWLYQAMWLAMTINFMFHSTYRIPTMYWLWMILLGIVG